MSKIKQQKQKNKQQKNKTNSILNPIEKLILDQSESTLSTLNPIEIQPKLLSNDEFIIIRQESAEEEIVHYHTEESSKEVHGTTTFSDESKGQIAEATSLSELTHLGDSTPSMSLGRFLERPVLIKDLTWTDIDQVGITTTIINPWFEYLNHPAIRRKIDNYAFMRGNLHVKAIINASPFYYGRAQLAYKPLISLRPDNTFLAVATEKELMPESQRLSIWVNPSDSEGGETILPFFYHKNWLDITDGTEVSNFGRFRFNIYNRLQSANGVGTISLKVQLFAWMSEVEVMGPTDTLAMQSSKEQLFMKPKQKSVSLGKKPSHSDDFDRFKVSTVATAVAMATEKAAAAISLIGLPELAPFALGVSTVASGVSSIAGMLGFTNTPLIEPTCTFKAQPLSQVASTEISGPLERLCIDPKNGISIDNKLIGLTNVDNMTINSIACRDSFLTNIKFSDTTLPGQVIFASKITPALYNKATYGSIKAYNMTPLAYMSNFFKYWRGDVVFTFIVVATQYHKGRIRISFDPNGDGGLDGADDKYTTNFTRIIDISTDRKVSIQIPYMQALGWLQTLKLSATVMDNTDIYANSQGILLKDSNLYNGVMTVKVINPLSAPVASTEIDIQVWVRGADNIEFSMPIDMPQDLTHMVPQSGESEEAKESEIEIFGGSSNDGHPGRYLVNFGEVVISFRQLLRRTVLYKYTKFPTIDLTKPYCNVHYTSPTYPVFYGYDDNGQEIADLTIGTGTGAFNFCLNTPYHYLTHCFIGMRGSMNKRFNFINDGNISVPHLAVTRNPDPPLASLMQLTDGGNMTNRSDISRQIMRGEDTGAARNSLASGASVTNYRIMPTLEYNVPLYDNYKFISTNPLTKNKGSAIDGSDRSFTTLQAILNPTSSQNAKISDTIIEEYFCIGPDFSVGYFLSIPTLFELNPPAAAT